jgi:CHAT domain-containing protein
VARTTLVASVAIVFCSQACKTRHTDEPRALLKDAYRLAMLGNFPPSATEFARAATLFRMHGDSRDALDARIEYLWVTAERGVSSAQDPEIKQALSDPSVRRDPKLLLHCLIAEAARERVVDEGSARAVWGQIAAVAKAVGDGRWQKRAQAELGEIAYMEGDVKNAVRLFKQAIIWQFLHADFGGAIYYSAVVGNGLVEAGQPENGLGYCDKAIELASVVKDAGFPYLAYQGKARALIALNRTAEADVTLKTALANARAQGNHAAETQLLIVEGDSTADRLQAIRYFDTAKSLSERGGFDHAFAWSSLELAKALRDTGNLRAAEATESRGLAVMRTIQDKYHLPQHLSLLADLKARSGKAREAHELYQQAADVIDAVLVNAPSHQIEASLISTLSNVYLGHFRLAATQRNNIAEAYEVIEQARGRSLAESLLHEDRIEPSTDPLTPLAQRQINAIQLALLREPAPAQRQRLLGQLFETEQMFTPIGRPTVLGTDLRHLKPAALATVQKLLHPDEIVLEYVLDEPRSFCIRITRSNSNIITLPQGSRAIDATIDRYTSEILTGKPGIESGRLLDAILLQPVVPRNDESKLIIVPDGKMNFLPFDSLIDSDGHRALDSHAISYCPSVTVLYLMRSRAPGRMIPARYLGVGNVDYAASGGRQAAGAGRSGRGEFQDFLALPGGRFGDLPNTLDEIVSASKILGWDSKLLLGRDATESAFKSQPLGTFGVIHLATHGVRSTEFPDRAALVMAPDASGEDGLLQAREIRTLPIRSGLVVLSACDTGIGTLEGQEGIANLVRAFLFAGAKSVVASLWGAGDVYSTHLMTRFFTHLAEGEDKCVALQRAKLDSLREFGPAVPPLYWAGFVIVGDASDPVVIATNARPPGSSEKDPCPGRQADETDRTVIRRSSTASCSGKDKPRRAAH